MKKIIIPFIFVVVTALMLCSCSQAPDNELEDLLNSLETSYLPGQEPVTEGPPEPFIETLTGQISEINETVFTIKTEDKKRYTVETANASMYGAQARVGLTAVVTYVNYGDKIKTITATSVLIEDVNSYTENTDTTTSVTEAENQTEQTTDAPPEQSDETTAVQEETQPEDSDNTTSSADETTTIQEETTAVQSDEPTETVTTDAE